MPKGVRHGEERHVVHSLSLEKGLSEIHRLIQPPSSVRKMISSFFRSDSEVDSSTEEISSRRSSSVLLPPVQQGVRFLSFSVSKHEEKI